MREEDQERWDRMGWDADMVVEVLRGRASQPLGWGEEARDHL